MFVERLRQLLKARPEMIKKFAIALFILSILLLGCFSAQLSQLEGLNGAIDPATLLEVQRLDKLKELNRLLDGVVEHHNPAFNFSTSLIPYANSRTGDFLGKLYLRPKRNDFMLFDFTPPISLSGVLIRTGNTQNPRDIFDHNTRLLARRIDSSEFETLGVFSDVGYLNVDLKESSQIASVKIVCGKDSDNGVLISEVLFRMDIEIFRLS